ncbi:MAG TPA: carboxypeptidase-like regulatory domain-containing protein [Chitinophagaceae bacterium]|jgi:hypothetical protein|nr:carboxypeptidase-like regulatory domain-containing protein [Chitinophagaceae bacterium]
MRNIYLILLSIISILSFHCQREPVFTPDKGNQNPSPITATLQGNVFDENGQPAIGVAVKAGSKSAITNAHGYFRIVDASLDKKSSLVTAEKIGYFKSYRTFIPTSGVNQVMLKLVKKDLAGSMNSTNGGDATLSNGAKISLPANGIVKASGGSYNGTVNVYASYINPASQDIAQTVPGSFMADDKDNKRVFLTSYGMLAVELESSSGEKLQITSGSAATLTMPIPSALQSTAPSSISLWYVDDQTGIWKEEGTAVKNGNSYVGQVKHFSFWNCDFSAPAVTLSMTLQNPEGLPFVHVHVMVRTQSNGAGHGWTDSLGQVSGLVPANENLTLEVLDECNEVIYSKNIGSLSQNTSLGTINLTNAGASIVTIKGKLLNCSNAIATNASAIIYYDNVVRYAKANNNGDFSITFTTCSSSPSVCQILGIDNATQQQGSIVNVTVTSPITNAGNISACGTSALQYINYNLDGVNYSISSAVSGDSLISHTYDSLTVIGTWINGFHPANDNISFSFNSIGTAGTYPVSFLSVQNISAEMIQPFNVIITNFPNATGGFYEGSFSGQFTNRQAPTTQHTITCTFRMRR